MTIVPVILSGGSGTRLWPVSTPENPKQFMPLVGDTSMFRQTLDRVADRTRFAAPLIVCGAGHVAHVERDLADAGVTDARIIVEPMARNTAPAIALAAYALGADDTQMLVMPSDHVMTRNDAFVAAVEQATAQVAGGALATFGITPTGPETGYGYIERGLEAGTGQGVFSVERFVEKPQLAAAEQMVAGGRHLWNAGIFLMRADQFLAELAAHAPDMAQAVGKAWAGAARDGARNFPEPAAFADCPSNSIDYAVMEKAANVVVTPVDPGWSDVGSWSALHALSGARDDADNAIVGQGVTIDCNGNLIRAGAGKRVALVGVEGLIVVAHGDDVLVIPRDRAQDVKKILDLL